MADREQVRRDADYATTWNGNQRIRLLGRATLALLAELEQAEARLAAVPALVEAGDALCDRLTAMLDDTKAGMEETREVVALIDAFNTCVAAYEQEPGVPS